MPLDPDALEAGGKAAADQLHQQMQLDFPVLARHGAGDPQQAGRAALHEITDDEHRSDAEVAPNAGIPALIDAGFGGVAQLRYSQGSQARLQPRECIQGLAEQLFGIAGGQHAARHLDVGERSRLHIDADVECGIGARGFAQQFQVGADGLGRRHVGHGLEIDRDLGADDIQPHGGTISTLRPGLRGQYVRGGQVWVAGIVGSYCHAPSKVPEKVLRL